MTRKEMSEIFAALLLAYPHADVFKGGIQKLGPTINLWTTCLSEIDFWTGQQAVIKLCRVCKFPPTIAEFREQADNVKSEVQQRVNSAWTLLRFDLEDKSPSEVYAALDERSQTKLAIAAMGGELYEEASHHNAVFVGRDKTGLPRYAHCRGTADRFRLDVAGSDKSYGFCHQGEGDQLFVFEAPIDLMSFLCLYPKDWKSRSYLSLGGVSGKALERFLSERPDVKQVFLCLDSDTAGCDACKRLAESLPDRLTVIRFLPARKDWNEVLQYKDEIPNQKFIAETITLQEAKTEAPVPMIRMSQVAETAVDWLWFPYIPFGKLTIIQGNPGEGKTYFAMQLAAACTNRKPLPDMEASEPFNVIYQTAEDGLGDTVKPRLQEAGADLDRVLVIDDGDQPLTLSDERLEKAIRQNSARLLIIDPVQAFLGANVDMNRANEVRPIFRRLGDVAQNTGCAILLIGHLNKAAGAQSTIAASAPSTLPPLSAACCSSAR